MARSSQLAQLSAAAQMITTRDSAQNSPSAHSTAHRKRPSARGPDTRGIRFGQPEYSEETVKPCGPRHLGCVPFPRRLQAAADRRGRGCRRPPPDRMCWVSLRLLRKICLGLRRTGGTSEGGGLSLPIVSERARWISPRGYGSYGTGTRCESVNTALMMSRRDGTEAIGDLLKLPIMQGVADAR